MLEVGNVDGKHFLYVVRKVDLLDFDTVARIELGAKFV